jgi:hypothetical protein
MGVDYRKWHPKNEENDRSIKEQGEQQEDWIGDETNLFGFDRVSAIASLLSDRFSLKWPTWAKWNTLASLAVMPTTTTKEDATIKKTKKKNRSQKHQIAFNSWTKRPGFSRNNSLHTTLTLLYPLFTRNLSITRWPMPPKRSTFFVSFLFFWTIFTWIREPQPVVLSRCHRVQNYKGRAIYANYLQQFAIELL